MVEILKIVKSTPQLWALVVLVGYVVAAFIVEIVITRLVLRITRRTRTTFDDELVAALKGPLFFTVVLIGIRHAMSHLVSSGDFRDIIHRALVTVAVLLWTVCGIRVGKSVLALLSRRSGPLRLVQPRTLPLFDMTVKTFILGGAAYGILITWHVDVTAWLASAGIIGIAIGFAAKDTLANLFAGIFILADAPYKIGDFVVIDSGERGKVTDIGIRSTRILTRDDIEVIIPNAAIGAAKIINESAGPYVKRRIAINVGVAYGSDLEKVRAVLLEVAHSSKSLLDDPAPRVRFREFGDSSLNLQLQGWIDDPVAFGLAVDELNTAVYNRFREEKIEIPFPQRDVHLKGKGEGV